MHGKQKTGREIMETVFLIDAHTHIDHYADRLEEAAADIEQNHFLSIGVSMDSESFERTAAAADNCPWIVPVFGIHPWEADRFADGAEIPAVLDAYTSAAAMIGEAGLDFFWVTEKKKWTAQREVFSYLCSRAGELRIPMNLHTKGAETEVLDNLKQYKVPPSVIHWYSGPEHLISQYLDAGCFFSISCAVMNSQPIRRIAQRIPADRLLLETDNPDACEWLCGQTGHPRQLIEVLQETALLRGMEVPELAEQTMQNWRQLCASVPSAEKQKKLLGPLETS